MKRYRRRLVEVEAERFDPGFGVTGCLVECLYENTYRVTCTGGDGVLALVGDWLVWGMYPDGMMRVVPDVTFRELFEEVGG